MLPRLGASSRPARRASLLAIVAILMTAALLDPSFAQPTPFGAPRPPAPPEGITGWLLAQQAAFYRALVQAVRGARAEGAAIGLLTLSFLYGVFHAAGPGHGKAVISSYLLADGSTYRRGLALTAAASLLQAFTAIAIVGVAAIILGATARAMDQTVRVLEIGSYALIIAFGLYLVGQKGRLLVAAWRGGARYHAHDHRHGHAHRAHGPDDGHTHGPDPADLKGKGWRRRGLTAVLAVGARPCSGAILVLVFALSQGIFWIGVLSTFVMAVGTAITVAAIASLALLARGVARRFAARPGGAGLAAFHALEVFGALLIVAFGVLLITGMMVSERLLPI
jgi:nickel/cobalt exporter